MKTSGPPLHGVNAARNGVQNARGDRGGPSLFVERVHAAPKPVRSGVLRQCLRHRGGIGSCDGGMMRPHDILLPLKLHLCAPEKFSHGVLERTDPRGG